MDIDDDILAPASIVGLHARMSAGELTALELTGWCLARIDSMNRVGPSIHAVIETNPAAEEIAARLDREREGGRSRGRLHGIPILLKDNIATADGMNTSAGSLSLVGARYSRDAFVADRLRSAGAVLLGKTNMSEWANFRSEQSSSGWSGREGQGLNPYALDRSPYGSSSGSAAAVAAAMAPASLGTETSGSILSPASANSVVGIKPTLGLTSRSGVIPISHSFDTVGPFARSVEDAGVVLDTIAGQDERDPATRAAPVEAGYPAALDPDALRGARIGVSRDHFFGDMAGGAAVVEAAIDAMRYLGATIIDQVSIPSIAWLHDSKCAFQVMLYEFKRDLKAYLADVDGGLVHSLADVIRFNREHASAEMPYFDQDVLEQSESLELTPEEYLRLLTDCHRKARDEGLDVALEAHGLDALLAPTAGPPFRISLGGEQGNSDGSAALAAVAGYPAISVPAGYVGELPVGLTLMGRPFSEARLIGLAHSFEIQTQLWHPPTFLASP